MISIPSEIKELLNSDSIRKNFRVHFNDGSLEDLTNKDIVSESVSFTESICSQDIFKLGLCESPTIEFECVNVPNVKGKEILCTIEIYCSSEIEGAVYRDDLDAYVYPINIGVFFIDSCKKQADLKHRLVSGYGRMAYEDWKAVPEQIVVSWFYNTFPNVTVSKSEYIAAAIQSLELSNVIISAPSPYDENGTLFYLKAYREAGMGQRLEKLTSFVIGQPVFDMQFENIVRKQQTSSILKPVAYSDAIYARVIEEGSGYCAAGIVIEPSYMIDNVNIMQNYIPRKKMPIFEHANLFLKEAFQNYGMSYLYESNNKRFYAITKIESTEDPLYLGSDNKIFIVKLHGGDTDAYICTQDKLQIVGSNLVEHYDQNDIVLYIDDDGESHSFSQKLNAYQTVQDLLDDLPEENTQNVRAELEPFADKILFEEEAKLEEDEIIRPQLFQIEESGGTIELDIRYPDNFPVVKDDVEAMLELRGKMGKYDRNGDFSLISLDRNLGIYPSNRLYPQDTLYPAAPNGGYLTKANYKTAWYDDEYTKPYSRVVLHYKDSEDEDAEKTVEYDLTDWEAEDFKAEEWQVYEVDNYVLQNEPITEEEAEAYAETIGEALKKIRYMPADITLQGQPQIEVGDALEVVTNEGGFDTMVLRRTMKGIQNLQDEFESKGE